MSEPKYVYRYPPCPDYDIEAMESWLSDMAARGYQLSRDGFFFGFGIFEKTEPRSLRYRLEASKRTSDSFNEYAPGEEARELMEDCGWRYVAARGNFHIYATDDPNATELHTDPEVQAITLDTVRKKLRNNLIAELVLLLLFFALRMGFGPLNMGGGHFLLSVIAIGTPAAILLFIIISWSLLGLFSGCVKLHKLRRRIKSGGGLDHNKDWRRGKWRYILSRIGYCLLSIALIALLFRGCTAYVDHENKIPLDEFDGTVPFATMSEFVPGGSYQMNDVHLSYGINTVELRSDWLAPVVIEYDENGDITTGGGQHISGGLSVTYIEARSEPLAGELFREFLNDGKASKRYEPLGLSLPQLDRCAAFVDVFPTVVLQKGNVVLRATFYQTGADELSLAEWAGVLAESIS